MKRKAIRMIEAAVVAVCMVVSVEPAVGAKNFWDTYSNKLVYNYAIKSGDVYAEGMNQRLAPHEVLSVSSKSFSQSFGTRVSEVAKEHRAFAIVCIFSRTPEKCYLDSVMKTTFDEIEFLHAPNISQKMIKKFGRFYTASLMKPKEIEGKEERASGVSRKKNFNPRFGFTLNDMELYAAAPFYTFRGIYVEPILGTVHGPSVSLMKNGVSLDFDREGLAIQYKTKPVLSERAKLTVTIRPEGEIRIENVYMVW